jgi:hypothetical protein
MKRRCQEQKIKEIKASAIKKKWKEASGMKNNKREVLGMKKKWKEDVSGIKNNKGKSDRNEKK